MDTWFTAKELARLLGVRPGTVNSWHTRGYLKVMGTRPVFRGTANLFDYWEAVAAERATRNSPNLRVPRSRVIVSP